MANNNHNFLNKAVRGVVIALSLQFILGMLVNLFAVPPDDPKFASEPLFIKTFFPAHGIIGLTLVVISLIVLYLAIKSGKEAFKKLSIYGLVGIFVAAGAGISTIILKDNLSEIASFVMSIGFLTAFASYIRLYFLLKD